jgi:hypothetical protein
MRRQSAFSMNFSQIPKSGVLKMQRRSELEFAKLKSEVLREA